MTPGPGSSFTTIAPATVTVSLSGTTATARKDDGTIISSGTTHDVVIQAAITSLATTGGRVHIKSGVYTLTAGLDLSKGAIVLSGETSSAHLNAGTNSLSGTVLKFTTDLAYAIKVYGTGAYPNTAQGVTLRDFTLRGYASHTGKGVYAYYANNLLIERVLFDTLYNAVYLEFGGDNTVNECRFTEWLHYGVYTLSPENNITSNKFNVSTNAGAGKKAIYLERDADASKSSDNCVVALNNIEHGDGSTCDGIYVKGDGNLIEGNNIEDMERHGILCPQFSNYNLILNNVTRSCGGSGIVISGNTNTVRGNYSQVNTSYGVDIEATAASTFVRDNYFRSNTAGTVRDQGTSSVIDQNTGMTTVQSKTAAYTALTSDDVVLCDATAAAFSVTLPTAASRAGKQFKIKKTDSSANAVTVDGNGTETIDGALTYALAAQYDSVTIVSDGANWMVV